MTFKEWDETRKNSLEMVEKTVHSLTQESQSSELAKLFGSTYTDSVTDEIREYTKTVTLSLIEEDLHQIAVALNKVAEGSVNAPRVMLKNPETAARGHWIPTTNCNYKCSCCGNGATGDDMKFCPECGTKMKDDNDDN